MGLIDKIKELVTDKKFEKELINIDKIMDDIKDSVINKDKIHYLEILKNKLHSDIDSKIFKDINPLSLASQDNIFRINRYENAEEICDNIPYCARSLKVLTDEICSPDDCSKRIVNFFIDVDERETDDNRYVEEINNINSKLGIENSIFDIVFDLLKMGDCFIEICNIKSDETPITQALLSEGVDEYNKNYYDQYKPLHEYYDNDGEEKKFPDIIMTEEVSNNNINLDDIKLIHHDPRFVVKIQSEKYKLCLGYLILPKQDNSVGSNNDYGLSSKGKTFFNSFNNQQDYFGIDKIYKKIIQSLKNKINDDLKIDKKEVKTLLLKLIKEYDDDNTRFKIRYVPPHRMEHFSINTKKFFPYGESIFYKTTFNAKLFIALESAIIQKRVSDSSDKRIAYFEMGADRKIRNIIEEFKEVSKRKRFKLDNLGNVSTIPSTITSFEAFYIPQNNGKKYLEFDTLTPSTNLRDVSEELKVFRDFIISSLEVPPSFLNQEENLSNKSALSLESIMFARTVVSYQSRIGNNNLTYLYRKIYKMIYNKELPDNFNVRFSPPKMLQIERESEYMDNISRVINTLKDLGIDREYLKQKYLPMDWDEIKKFEIKNAIESKTKPKDEDDVGGMY